MSSKNDFLIALNKARKGLPVDLIEPIDRSIDNEHVQTPPDYKNVNTLSDFYKMDIMTVSSGRGTIIRPIIGSSGSGKSTELKRIERLIGEIIKENRYIIIKINLKEISLNREEFLQSIINKIYLPIKPALKDLLSGVEYSSLLELFKSPEMVKHLSNLSKGVEEEADKYFLDLIREDKIFNFIWGIFELITQKGKILIILIDELEYLINNDPSGLLKNLITEKFMRDVIDKYNINVYIAFTCFKKSIDDLANTNLPFYRIIRNSFINLSDLSEKEKNELVMKIVEESGEYTFGKLKAPVILNKLNKEKGKLDYYFLFGNVIQFVCDEIWSVIDHFQDIYNKITAIYEKNAREGMAIPALLKEGFQESEIAKKEHPIGGSKFDIFAEKQDKAKNYQKRAFGSIKSVQCNMRWANEFLNFLKPLQESQIKQYNPEKDIAMFIAPSYVKDARGKLESSGVKCIEYIDPEIEKIKSEMTKKEVVEEKLELTPEEIEVINTIKQWAPSSWACSKDRLFKNFSRELIDKLCEKKKLKLSGAGKNQKFKVL